MTSEEQRNYNQGFKDGLAGGRAPGRLDTLGNPNWGSLEAAYRAGLSKGKEQRFQKASKEQARIRADMRSFLKQRVGESFVNLFENRGVFIGDCTQFPQEDIHAWDDSPETTQIDNAEFRQLVGEEAYQQIEGELHYDEDFPMEGDWHITYEVGSWHGKPCACLHWSGIHHFFLLYNS